MSQLTSELIKKMAKNLGANLVGITSVDRFEGAPPGQRLQRESSVIYAHMILLPEYPEKNIRKKEINHG